MQRYGASPQSISAHYDIPTAFFELWLDPSMCYSCAMFGPRADDLAAAQVRKLAWYGDHLRTAGARILDVGTGWGAAARFLAEEQQASVCALTLSEVQRDFIASHETERLDVQLIDWQDFTPTDNFDVVLNLEAMEHFTQMEDDGSTRTRAYREHFARVGGMLTPDGRFGLQTFCYSGATRERVDELNPLAVLLRERIFPESALPYLSELVTAWEPLFEIRQLRQANNDYCRTLQAWYRNLSTERSRAESIVGAEVVNDYLRYLAGGVRLFAEGYWSLYRIILERR